MKKLFSLILLLLLTQQSIHSMEYNTVIHQAFLSLPDEHYLSQKNRLLRQALQVIPKKTAAKAIYNIFDKKREELLVQEKEAFKYVMADEMRKKIIDPQNNDAVEYECKRIKKATKRLHKTHQSNLNILYNTPSTSISVNPEIYKPWLDTAIRICTEEYHINPAAISWGIHKKDKCSTIAGIQEFISRQPPFRIVFNEKNFTKKATKYSLPQKKQNAILEHAVRHELTHALQGHNLQTRCLNILFFNKSTEKIKDTPFGNEFHLICEKNAEVLPTLKGAHAAKCAIISRNAHCGYSFADNDIRLIHSLWEILETKKKQQQRRPLAYRSSGIIIRV